MVYQSVIKQWEILYLFLFPIHCLQFNSFVSLLWILYLLSEKTHMDEFDFGTVNFPFLDGDVPRRTSYRVYIFHPIRFARAFSNVTDFNCRNKAFTAKLLRPDCRYHKRRKAFSKFYLRQSGLVKQYNAGLTLLQQGISKPEFYSDLVYRLRKLWGNLIFRNDSKSLLIVIKV